MAEDSDMVSDMDSGMDTSGGEQRRGKGQKRGKKKKPCNTRIDQLALPTKRLVWTTYHEFSPRFEPKRRELVKKRMQEMFSLTAQQAEVYFQQQRKHIRDLERKRRRRLKTLKRFKIMRDWEKRRKAYRKFRKIFQIGIRYARTHEVPPLVTARVRNMADVILEQLCEIRGIPEVPNRNDTDKMSRFLIAVSDWIAIIMERIYFEVQLKKNEELEEIEKNVKSVQVEEKNEDVLSREVKVEELDGEPDEVEEEEEEEEEEEKEEAETETDLSRIDQELE